MNPLAIFCLTLIFSAVLGGMIFWFWSSIRSRCRRTKEYISLYDSSRISDSDPWKSRISGYDSWNANGYDRESLIIPNDNPSYNGT